MPWTLLLDLRVLLGVALIAVGIYAKVQSVRVQQIQAEYAQFRADVESEAAKAQVRNARREVEYLEKRGRADAENKRTTDLLRVTLKRMRDANASSSRLPEAPATSARPDLACFDRAEYQREDGAAFERLQAGARSLADEGTASTVDLDSAKKWASDTAASNADKSGQMLFARIEPLRSTVLNSPVGCRLEYRLYGEQIQRTEAISVQ